MGILVSSATRSTLDSMNWFAWIGMTVTSFQLAYTLIKRNYLEVINNELHINEHFFSQRVINLDKIEKFDIEPSPFTSSKIILKDNSRVEYSDSQAEDKALKAFMAQFNIPVE